jgi:hypothetical protein
MNIDLSYCCVNGLTGAVLAAPLCLVVSPSMLLFLLIVIPLAVSICYSYFSLARSASSFEQFTRIMLAHRGGRPIAPSGDHDEFPENTMAAFRWASNEPNVDGIELDVWLSKDNIPMINHDAYLGHTFVDCRQTIGSLTCAQLKQLTYLKERTRHVDESCAREAMPTLEEVIVFLAPTRLKLSMFTVTRRIVRLSSCVF